MAAEKDRDLTAFLLSPSALGDYFMETSNKHVFKCPPVQSMAFRHEAVKRDHPPGKATPGKADTCSLSVLQGQPAARPWQGAYFQSLPLTCGARSSSFSLGTQSPTLSSHSSCRPWHLHLTQADGTQHSLHNCQPVLLHEMEEQARSLRCGPL